MDSYWQSAIRDKAVSDFEAIAMELYAEQYTNNPIYHQFCSLIRKEPTAVHSVDDIPF